MPDATLRITPDAARRRAKLLEGLDALRTTTGLGDVWSHKTLFVLGGVLAPTGLLLIVAGWFGAARTPYVFEQVPYLISGGLVGLGLTVLGGFLYFAHWITELVKTQRAQTDALLAALAELRQDLAAPTASAAGSTGSARRRRTPTT